MGKGQYVQYVESLLINGLHLNMQIRHSMRSNARNARLHIIGKIR